MSDNTAAAVPAEGTPKKKRRINGRKIGVILLVIAVIGVGLGSALLAIQYTSLQDAGSFLSLPVLRLPSGSIMTAEEAKAYTGGDMFVRTIVDDPGSYIAHPDTAWVDDGSANGKILAVYPLGHGKGEVAMRESTDMGVTWSERRDDLPESWVDSQETPTIYNLTEGTSGDPEAGIVGITDKQKNQVLVLISGCPYWPATTYEADGFNFSYSLDGGDTWTEFEKFYGKDWASESGKEAFDAIVAMASLTQLKNEDGSYKNEWMGLFHDHEFNVYKTILTATTVSYDAEGKLSIDWDWSEPTPVFGAGSENDNYAREHGMCEVEAIRVSGLDESSPYYSEYKDAIVLLGRAERRTSNSLISVSTDEGETWTTIRELPYDLCGDRHKAEYLNAEGDLIVSFRQIIPEKPGPLSVMSRLGDGWYAWVGNIADILSYADDDPANDTLGDMLTEVGGAPNLDNGYSGVIVKNGTVNLVSYGYFLEGAVNPCIMSCTFSATLFGE